MLFEAIEATRLPARNPGTLRLTRGRASASRRPLNRVALVRSIEVGEVVRPCSGREPRYWLVHAVWLWSRPAATSRRSVKLAYASRLQVREENVFRGTLFSRGHACFAGGGHAGHRCFAKRIFLSTETEDEEEWLEWVDWRSTHMGEGASRAPAAPQLDERLKNTKFACVVLCV